VSGLEPGSSIGRYQILARLRAGAMGALYVARPKGAPASAKLVAIKVIHEHLAQNKRFVRMFMAEAKLSQVIEDSHIVRVDEFGEADGRYFLAMDYIHGVSLAQALGILKKRGGLPIDVSVAIAIDIANGLHAAHEARDERGQLLNVVHRDVSPHNVLVSYDGHVKIIDFGIAKAKDGVGQTMTGSIRGKLAYMSPEQARSAKHVDRRADLYAIGLVLWEMLVGRRMFQGKSDIDLLNMIRDPKIIAPSAANGRVPKELDPIVLQLLEQDPKKRPSNGAEVARMLARAWPASTKLRAKDIAAAMKAVRDAAKLPIPIPQEQTITASGAGEETEAGEENLTEDFIEQVAKEATLFDDEPQKHTVVVATPPIARMPTKTVRIDTPPPAPPPSSGRLPFDEPPASSGPISVEGPPNPLSSGALPIEGMPDPGEITKNHRVQPRPSAAYRAMTPIDVPPPFVPKKEEGPQPPQKTPFWLSGPVLGTLTGIFVIVFVFFAGGQLKWPSSSPPAVAGGGNQHPERTPLENAREAAAENNHKGVREYLEKNVRSGKASTEEVQLVMSACMQMGDRKCVNEISAKYPSIPRPESLGYQGAAPGTPAAPPSASAPRRQP